MQIKKYTLTCLLVISFFALFVLYGCGAEESLGTSISIDKKGHVTNIVCEEFEQDYYDISELSDMAASEISSYNSECLSEKVTLESLESVNDGSYVKMVVNYKSVNDYASYNKTSLFYGTVQDALDRGYDISEALVNGEGEQIGQDGISDYLSRHIIITSDKSDFITPYNIAYYTQGVVLNGKKEAVLSNVSVDEVQLLLSK
ncbi:MAG: hypothetical protein K5792_09070 [Butyrivibrio sp.]|nr:hypothetical protein [Butyrivibrio sp.]